MSAGGDSENTDICAWAQIECTDGIVTVMWAASIQARAPNGAEVSIKMEWLPPTMKFIHFECIRVPSAWENMCFPRDLKYLFLDHCKDLNSQANGFNFTRLPQRMEEIILLNVNIRGTICFVGLPETMRFVYFCVFQRYVKCFVVHYKSLPLGLKGLHATVYERGKVKVTEIGKPRGVKLQQKHQPSILLEGSQHIEIYGKRLW